MHPVICEIGPFRIYSYGLMLALGVLVTSWFVAREAKKINVSRDMVYDLAFWVVLGGILGARLFYVFLNLSFFLSEPLETLMVQKGGLAWQGSLAGGLVAAVFFLRQREVPVFKFLDLAAPYVALGHAIGRVGCFLNGCCYGKPVAWGVRFPLLEGPVHPAQLYMVAGQLAIFAMLLFFRRHARYDGQVFVWYLMLSAVERFMIEFFRGDHEVYLGLSIFQYVCLFILTAALILNARLYARTNPDRH
jgi:phosphatidylglycerol:prolipoprotein diacylglycerol transferase